MNTLELTIQHKTDNGCPVIAALTRPGGFLPLRREGTLNLDIEKPSEFQFEPLEYGKVLGEALFTGEILHTYYQGLAGGEPLRVLLSIEAPDLRALDWHRLAAPFDGHWRFLASQQNTPFSLAVSSPASAHFPALGRRDLRALVLVAGPESLFGDYTLAPFDVAATIASIQAALGDIPCDILPNPSLDALCATLTATPYTILHLVCHGAVNERGETILYFPKDERRTPTPATDLLNRLSSLARLPHFAFVCACESALPQNGLGSLAGRLVRELGLPAVLAMTDRVSIATAGAIAAPFYAHLYQHGQPDLALTQSLAGLQGAHDLTVPAIFSRLGDRPLFDDNAERALTEKELEFGLVKLAEFLPERAPVMDSLRDTLTRRLRSTLGADSKSLSESNRAERKETLDQLNSLSLEALDLSFNALCLGQTPPVYDSRSPFRGLESFRPEDAAYFFGRETLTRKLVQKLNKHNLLAVLGASGSGKSSLVMAGLIPALNIPYAVFRPGAEPLVELEKALQVGLQLIVVDQFEELFTISVREQRADLISRLLEQAQKIRVVITLRADFLGDVAPFKSLKEEVQNHQEIISPMDEAELRRAMEGQAGCAGLRFESDLSQQMLDDVSGEPGAMPLLQHALWTLWTRRHGRWLRAEEYRAFGGVKQAIASTAEAVYARCTEFEKERLRDIFLRLTRLDEGADGRDTRRRVLLRDLILADSDSATTTLLIKQLADARLVIVTGDEVEVAHEALVRHWERLRAWLNDDRDNLRLREDITDDARRWEKAHRDESLLNHRGASLELAMAMSKNPRYRLNLTEQAYLNGCVRLREKEKAAIARQRQYIIAGVSAALVMMIMAVLGGWGWSNLENSKQLGYQIATATYSQGFAQQQAATAESAKATAVVNENLAKTAQANAEKQSQITLARQLASQAQFINTTFSLKKAIAVMLSIESLKLFPNGDAARFLINDNTLAIPTSRMTHDDAVYSVAFSPDGKYVVSGSLDGTMRVWAAQTGSEVTRMTQGMVVTSVAFSPDGKYIASGSDHTTCVWDARTGQEVSRMTYDDRVTSVAFSADGKYVVSGSWDNTARVWESWTGKEIARITHDDYVTSVAFSADGKYVVSGSWDNTARVWESWTGKEIARMTHNDRVESVAFSPNSKYVVSGSDDHTARVWETMTGKEIARMTHDGIYSRVRSVAFSPDGKYVVSGSDDYTARVWETITGKEIARMTHNDVVNFVVFSPDGKYVVSGSDDGTARLLEIATGKEVSRMTHDGEVRSIAFSPDGLYVVSGSHDNTVRVWKTETGKEIVRMTHDSGVRSIAFSADGQYVISGSDDGTARVWETGTGKEIARMTHDGGVRSVAFSPDGQYVVSGGCDKLNSDRFSCFQGTVRVWETTTGKEIARMIHNSIVLCVAFSPDGKYITSGSDDLTVRVWEVLTRKEIVHMTHDGDVLSVAFSPDGKYIVSGSGGLTLHVWEIGTGKEISLMTHKNVVNSVAFSPNGKYVVSGSEFTVRIWEALTGKEITHMTHDGFLYSVSFSPDGKYIVSGSDDLTARVWETGTWVEIARMTHNKGVRSVAFSPDGKYVVSGSDDGTVRVWVWQAKDLIANACKTMLRNLTRAEWQQYIGDALPYQAVCPNLPIEP